jgi:hypothetical protein
MSIVFLGPCQVQPFYTLWAALPGPAISNGWSRDGSSQGVITIKLKINFILLSLVPKLTKFGLLWITSRRPIGVGRQKGVLL